MGVFRHLLLDRGQQLYRARGDPIVPSITTILRRFIGEWAALLQPEATLTAGEEIGATAWRDPSSLMAAANARLVRVVVRRPPAT